MINNHHRCTWDLTVFASQWPKSMRLVILLALLLCYGMGFDQHILKDEACDAHSSNDMQKIEELESLIIKVQGTISGQKLIAQVKKSPESFMEDNREIIKELATILMDKKISNLSMRQLLHQIRNLEEKVKNLENNIVNSKC